MQGFTFGQAAPAFGMFSGASPPPQPGAQQPAGFSFGQGPAAQAAEAQSPAGGFGGFAQPSQSSQPTSLFAFGASQPPQAQQQQQQQQPGPFGVPAQAAAQPQGGFAAFSQPAGGAPPPFGVSQQPQQQAPLGGAQQAQQSFPPAGPSAFGAGFAPQAAAQPSQPAIVGFGAMPPAATAPANFAGAPAPPAQPGTSLFSFGQAAGLGQPTAPTTAATPVSLFDPPATTAATPSAAFGFGTGAQQQVPAFLGGQQPAGAARPAFGSAAPKFDFGASAKRKEHQQQQGPPASGNASSGGAGQGGEEDGAMPDLEAEKQRALASMPKFGGSSGGGMKAGASGGVAALLSRAGGTAARPRGRSPSPAPSSQKDVDAEEQARRAQRAARFNAAAALAAGTAGGGGAEAPSPAALLASVVAGSAGYPSSSKGGRGASGTGAMRRVPSSLTANLAVQGAGGGFDEGDAMGADEDEEGAGSHRSAIVGTCEDMCPEEERNRRQGMNDLQGMNDQQIFERDPQAPSTTNASLAVKRFARTVDDPHPSQFRTRAALQRTMAHLRGILDRTDVRLGLVHKFLWDRYRSVRQDLYIQGIQDAFGVRIFEEIVRFHILSEHELCAEDQSVTDMEGFNSHLNMEQMNKALISLDDMYNKLAAAGTPVDTEPEFRAYHLLSLMSQHGKFKGDQQVYLGTIKGLRDEVKSSPAVQWVLSLQQAFASSNAVRFSSLTRQAPYLLACLAHIYFPQMRKRVLRMLSETLSPSPARPAAIELSWLQEVLLLDTLDEAAELATTYGFEVFTENGIAAALLVKGGFTEPEQPALRRPSQLIRSMAQGARSTVVTTPALPPMSADQLAQFEAQRLETRLRQQEAAVQAQHAAAAEAQRRQQAELVAAQAAQQAQQEAREQRRREEVMQQVLAQQAAEEQRAREAEAQRQHAIKVAARQQQEVAWRLAQEAERRAKEEEQRRWHAEQARQAAEAQRARQEAAWREAQAREAERRRLAQEEERRLAEQRRVEEEKRRRRAVKQRMAITRLYFARWRREAAWLAAERARQARVRASLKACRTAAASSSAAEQAAQQDEDGLPVLQQGAAGPQQAQQAKQQGLDLPSLVAPLLVQRSPSADPLYWKVVLLGTAAAAGTAQHQLSVLGRWLAQQLSRGRLVGSPAGRAYVEGPITLQVGSGSGPRLSTCVVQPHALNALSDPHSGPSTLSAAVAGASAIIVPVEPLLGPANGRLPYQDGHIPHGFGQSNGGSSSSMSHVGLSFVDGFGSGAASAKLEPLWQVLGALPQGIRVPVLLVAPDLPAAQQWQELVRQQQQQGRLSGRVGSSSSRGGPLLHVVSASAQQQPHKAGTSLDGSGPANNSGIGPPFANGASSGVEAATSFSVQQLVQGLRWLAARAPQQPVLEVGSLEEAAREGLGLVVQALHQGSDQGGAAPEDYVDAFNAVLSLVADAIRNALQSPAAAWQWPPAELSPPALKQWHSEASMDQLLDSLAAVHLRADQQMPPSTGGAQQTALALYHRLGALDRLAPPLILPHEVHALLRRRLADAAADAAAAVLRRRQQQRQLALPARVPRFNQTLHIENGVGGAAGRSAADASAFGWRDAAAGMKRKHEPESQSVGQHDNQRRPGASQVQQQPLLPCSGPQAGSGIGRGQGVRQLHSALQRLQQQLAQESEAQQRLSVQAHDLSYGAAGAPAPDVNEACSTGLRDGILAPGAVAGTAAASNAAAEPKGSAARAPGALGELLFRLQAERQAAASLQANLQTAAALL
ncbi:hypothetical protein N2152v2_010261 [Parachlorella kessleri]